MSRDVKIVLGLFTSVVGVTIWYLWWGSVPPIVRDLRGGDAARVELTGRLKEKFPDGTAEETVLRELTRQGFVSSACRTCKPNVRTMTANVLMQFPCTATWYVQWLHHDAGTITLIDAGWSSDCI